MPIAPVPNKTKITVDTILQIELIIIILGNDFVSSEATSIERNRPVITNVPIRGIDKSTRSNSILRYILSLKNISVALQRTIPENIISNDAFTSIAVFPICLSEKLLARKRVTPVETPTSTIAEKIRVREITVEEIPITSGETNLDIKIHKTYPKKIAIKFSR
jgi:hypothetical protein